MALEAAYEYLQSAVVHITSREGVLLVLLLLLITRLAWVRASSASRLSKLLPPSPPGKLPIIGHLHLIGSHPHVSFRDLHAKHGRDGLMLVHVGAVPTVVVSTPQAAEAVLRTHDHILASRPRSRVWDVIMYGQTDSCFAPYGDYFRKARKLVTVHLLNASKVRAQRPAREEEVRGVMACVGKAAAAGEALDMSEILHAFVNDLVCRAVSGKAEGLSKLFRELTDVNAGLLGGFNVLDFLPSLGRIELVRKMACATALRVRKRWDLLLDKLIDDHAAKTGSRREDEAEQDFIDVSLSLQQEYGFTRDHIKAILIVRALFHFISCC